uniref:hypothetical protein n=1 Tax=Algoriphagus sp. TaxID=1872435 RepID=UPI00404891A6
MNKILIYFLLGTLGTMSCSSKSNETKEKNQQEDSLFSTTEAPALPVAFLPLDSLPFYPDARVELNTPLGNQVFKPGKVPFEFNIKNFSQSVTAASSQRFAMILNGGGARILYCTDFSTRAYSRNLPVCGFLVG